MSASRKPEGELRRGWTTGACATAAARAAYEALVTGHFPNPVTIRLPQGQRPSFALDRAELAGAQRPRESSRMPATIPTSPYGALVLASVRRGPPAAASRFGAGDGVGTVSHRPGWPLRWASRRSTPGRAA